MDYYEVLGVSKTATEQEIATAYRKKSLQHHPDKNPDNPQAIEEFKKCSQAFEVLKDPERRSRYDRFGPEQPRGGGQQRPPHFDDFFTDFFRQSVDQRKNGEHLHKVVNINLEDVLSGIKVGVDFGVRSICTDCAGEGGEFTICQSCNGKGMAMKNLGGVVISTPCTTCRGKGKLMISKCPECKDGYVDEADENVAISVPPGIDSGMTLMFRGHGEPGKDGGRPGNLHVQIIVKPHPVFERLADGDVLIKVPVSYPQLVFGDEIEVPSLGSGKITVKIPSKTQPGKRLKLARQGLPKFCATGGLKLAEGDYGDMLVELKLEIPEHLHEEYVELVEKMVKFDTLDNYPAKNTFHDYLIKERP